jgi:Flp pilus assembly pilin Flp
MKSVIAGIIAATLLSVVAAFVLDTRVQESVDQRFSTSGVRL